MALNNNSGVLEYPFLVSNTSLYRSCLNRSPIQALSQTEGCLYTNQVHNQTYISYSYCLNHHHNKTKKSYNRKFVMNMI